VCSIVIFMIYLYVRIDIIPGHTKDRRLRRVYKRFKEKWKKNEKTERTTSLSSFLVPRGPFGLIAARLECRSYRIFSFLRRRHFLRRSVTNDMVFKASAAETLNKCSRIVGSFKRQGLLHGSCLLYMSPFQISSVNRTCAGFNVINRFVIALRRSRVRRKIPLNDHCRITAMVFKEINVSDPRTFFSSKKW